MRRAIGDSIFGYMRVKAWIWAGFALLICAGFIIGGVVTLFDALNFYIEAEVAEGRVAEVVEVNHPTDGGVDRFYYASRIAFVTASSETVTWQESDIDQTAPHDVGQTVAMLYLPADPRDARIYSLEGLFGLPFTYLGIGLGLMFLFMPRLLLNLFGDFSDLTVNLIVSGTICLLGLGLLGDAWLFTLQTRVTEGEVVELIKLKLEDEQKQAYESYRPRISFKAEDGAVYTFKLGRAHRTPKYAIRDKLPVRYPLDRPAAATLNNTSTLWFPGGAAIGFGLLYLVMSIGTDLLNRALAWMFYGRRKRRPPAPPPVPKYRPAPPSWSPASASQTTANPGIASAPAANPQAGTLRSRTVLAAETRKPAGEPLRRRVMRRAFSGYISGREKVSAFLGLAASGAVIVLALVELFGALNFYATAESAEGRVVERIESSEPSQQYDEFRYASRIAFTTPAGQEITWLTDDSERPTYAVGQAVSLLYQASDTSDVRPDSLTEVFGLPVAGLALGLCMLLVLVPQVVFSLIGEFSRVTMTLMATAIIAAAGVALIAQGKVTAMQTQVALGQVTSILQLDKVDEKNQAYPVYRPRVSFKAGDGRLFEVDLGRAHRVARFEIGDTVQMEYPDGNPGAAYLQRESDAWFTGALVIAFAVFHLLFSLGLEFIRRIFARLFGGESQAEYG